MRSYNIIAPFYSTLQRMVFGKQLQVAQAVYLDRIVSLHSILIVGGGDGVILEQLEKMHFNGRVSYVDSSSKMIEFANKRKYSYTCEFYCNDIKSFNLEMYDGIITPFFLDQFTGKELVYIIRNIFESIKSEGFWIHIDFTNSQRITHRIIHTLMYLFFRITAGIESKYLEDARKYIVACDMELLHQSKYKNGWIVSSLFRKL